MVPGNCKEYLGQEWQNQLKTKWLSQIIWQGKGGSYAAGAEEFWPNKKCLFVQKYALILQKNAYIE